MNGKDFAIGVLSVTAVILLSALILVQTLSPQPAVAGTVGTTVGQYVVTSGQLDDTTDLLYVLDTTAQRMNVYGIEPQLGRIVVIQQLDMRPQGGRRR